MTGDRDSIRAVLLALPKYDCTTTAQLCKQTGYSQQRVTGALRWLRGRGLVEMDRDIWPDEQSRGLYWLDLAGRAAREIFAAPTQKADSK